MAIILGSEEAPPAAATAAAVAPPSAPVARGGSLAGNVQVRIDALCTISMIKGMDMYRASVRTVRKDPKMSILQMDKLKDVCEVAQQRSPCFVRL